jgi:hypothetical protein
MQRSIAAASLSLTLAASEVAAATKEAQQPDPEMLKMMEFLREMEMIKQIDILKDMQQVESVGDPQKVNAPSKTAPVKRKEATK